VPEADSQDIALCRGGDEAACRRIMDRYRADVERQMWRFTRDAADHAELVQDVFVKVFTHLNSYRAKAPFAHWLRRIATNTGYRYWRSLARDDRRRERLEWEARCQRGLEPPATPSDAGELLHTLLQQLPAPERLVLTLMYFEQCGTEEIAERTGWTRANAKARAFRARKKLRQLVEAAGIGSPYDV